MSVFLRDPDVTVYCGDVLDVLPTLEEDSVDCVVTSPPYWGLRDYGVDGQLGLEETFDEFVDRLVGVFREVRRVLAPHGTCWLNMGDSYATGPHVGRRDHGTGNSTSRLGPSRDGLPGGTAIPASQNRPVPAGLKPKDLLGQPWAVAFALRQDGWYLRSCVIWHKPNPMPESVTDRPTTSHEYVFLLTREPRYFYDADAVREPHTDSNSSRHEALQHHGTSTSDDHIQNPGPHRVRTFHRGLPGVGTTAGGWNSAGRNLRSVWTIPTQPYPEAHFATFPEELVRRCLLAGCPERVCRTCGKARERLVEKEPASLPTYKDAGGETSLTGGRNRNVARMGDGYARIETLGFTDCGHSDYRPGIVLDPFLGSGTTAHVARKLNRKCVGVELNEAYCELAARRLAQLSLLAEGVA